MGSSRAGPFLLGLVVALAACQAPAGAKEVSDADAEALMRRSGCFKCHAVAKRKDGPSYEEVAKKYRGRAGAEERLVRHVTTSPMVKMDGEDEPHGKLKTGKPEEVGGVVRWILGR